MEECDLEGSPTEKSKELVSNINRAIHELYVAYFGSPTDEVVRSNSIQKKVLQKLQETSEAHCLAQQPLQEKLYDALRESLQLLSLSMKKLESETTPNKQVWAETFQCLADHFLALPGFYQAIPVVSASRDSGIDLPTDISSENSEASVAPRQPLYTWYMGVEGELLLDV